MVLEIDLKMKKQVEQSGGGTEMAVSELFLPQCVPNEGWRFQW